MTVILFTDCRNLPVIVTSFSRLALTLTLTLIPTLTPNVLRTLLPTLIYDSCAILPLTS